MITTFNPRENSPAAEPMRELRDDLSKLQSEIHRIETEIARAARSEPAEFFGTYSAEQVGTLRFSRGKLLSSLQALARRLLSLWEQENDFLRREAQAAQLAVRAAHEAVHAEFGKRGWKYRSLEVPVPGAPVPHGVVYTEVEVANSPIVKASIKAMEDARFRAESFDSGRTEYAGQIVRISDQLNALRHAALAGLVG